MAVLIRYKVIYSFSNHQPKKHDTSHSLHENIPADKDTTNYTATGSMDQSH